ncbi:MAG: hypothetical protein ACXVZ3_13540, partial [Gaiellaceae bacterium]
MISVLLGMRFSQVWVNAVAQGTFGNLTVAWSPAPVKTAGVGALIPMPTPDPDSGCEVRGVITDEIGHDVTASAWVSDYIENGGYRGKLVPPKRPPQVGETWPHPGEWITHTLGPLTEIEGRKIVLSDHTL